MPTSYTWGGVGWGVGWGNNVLALAYLYNILFLYLRHTLGVGLAGGVGWGNNVLALAYLVYFFLCLRHTLGVGWLGGGLGQQHPGTCVLSVLFPVPTSVSWGNNVLALAYLIYFSCAYVIHLRWGSLWVGWGNNVLALAYLI